MINIINLSFSYKNGKKILDNLNIEIVKNKIFGIYGPSGSGKTTLLHIIGGLIKPKIGEISYLGKSIYKLAYKDLIEYRKNIMGYSFQNFYLLDNFSVDYNLDLPFIIGNNKDQVDKEWKSYLLESLGMGDLLHKNIERLSGGEKERVSIIKAMIHKPKILITDEPGSYLNKDLRYRVYDLIKNYSKQDDNICCYSSHDESMLKYFKLKKITNNKGLSLYLNK